MSGNQTPGNGNNDGGSAGAASGNGSGQAQNQNQGGNGGTSHPDDDQGSPRRSRGQLRTVEEANAEAAAYRVDLRRQEREYEKLQQQMTELQTQHQAQLSQATAAQTEKLSKLQTRLVDNALRTAALEHGLVDMDLLPLVDRAKVKYNDDTGEVEGLSDAFTALKTSKPTWFKEGSSAGQGQGQGQGQNQNQNAGQGQGQGAGQGQRSASGSAARPNQGANSGAGRGTVRDAPAQDYATAKANMMKSLRALGNR